nr:hypothetical protein [uncultured Chitinophaga sp.]
MKPFRIILAIASLLTGTMTLYAQEKNHTLPQVVPKSPDVASLEKYGEIPVSKSSGTANVSLNLTTIQVGQFSLPITLQYHSNGLRVNEIPSCIGEGWSLDAGGMVSFNQRGANDFGSYGMFGMPSSMTDLTKFLSGTMTAVEKEAYFTRVLDDLEDSEFDQYNYSFAGKGGSFFFDMQQKAVSMPKSDLKIIRLPNGVQINDNDGNQYFFTDPEYASIGNSGPAEVRASFNDISAYRLSKIITKDNRTIVFKYKLYSFGYSQTRSNISHVQSFPTPPPPCPASTVDHFDEITTCGYLLPDSILFDQGYVKFKQSLGAREDIKSISSNAAVPSITGFYLADTKGQKVKEFTFEQGYFGTNQRLKLSSVTESGASVAGRRWSFTYYREGMGFPGYLDNGKDHWGYYNGKTNASLIPDANYKAFILNWKTYNIGFADRQSNFDAAVSGMLKEIKYPTGGSSVFEYEPNQVKVRSYSDLFNLSNFFKIDNSSYYTGLAAAASWDNPSGTVTGSFVVPAEKPVRIRAFVNYDPTAFEDPQYSFSGPFTTEAYQDLGHAFGMNYDYNSHTSGGEVFSVFPAGTYTYTLTAGRTYDNATNQYIPKHCNFFIDIETSAPPEPFVIGGCRIAAISNSDGVNPAVVKRFVYSDSLNQVAFRNIPNYLTVKEMAIGEVHPESGCASCGLVSTVHDESVIPGGGSHIEYQYVTEYDSSQNKQLGKTESTFLLSSNVAGSYVQPYVAPVNTSWRAGMLLNQKIYKTDAGGFQLVQEIQNDYAISSRLSLLNGIKLDYALYCATNAPGSRRINQSLATLFTEHFYLSRSQTIDYTPSAPALVKQKDIAANSLRHTFPVLESSPDSRLNVVKEKTLYSFDYDTTVVSTVDAKGIRYLQRANIMVPIEKLQIKTINGTDYIVGGSLFTYWDDKPVVNKLSVLKIDQPLPLTGFTQSSINGSGSFTNDNRYEVKAVFDQYDSFNNIVTNHLDNNTLLTYLWDYQRMLPVAKVANAAIGDIAYTSFEADQKGNWIFSGTPVSDATAPTGTKCYNLSAPLSKNGLTPGKSYTLSYWTKNSTAFSIPGTQSGYPMKLSTVNGWTQFVHQVVGITGITFPASGLIDEVRLYPADASMETFTYDPLIGITTRCDEKGLVTYYSYDGLGRLKTVRDQDGKIVRQFDYQFQAPLTQ